MLIDIFIQVYQVHDENEEVIRRLFEALFFSCKLKKKSLRYGIWYKKKERKSNFLAKNWLSTGIASYRDLLVGDDRRFLRNCQKSTV